MGIPVGIGKTPMNEDKWWVIGVTPGEIDNVTVCNFEAMFGRCDGGGF